MPLPIQEIQAALTAASTRPHPRIVIEAPTGSGKSTQIPQMLLDGPLADPERGEIVVLQPRRLAARMLAKRVAEERNVRLGEEVGYQVRFEGAVSARTRIRFVTEGLLLRQIVGDPELSGVGAVVLDEFHERHFFGDLGLARCLEVQRDHRPDLVLAVMSATLEAEPLTTFLGEGCVHLRSEGRTFPVEIRHEAPRQQKKSPVWDRVARAIRDQGRRHGFDGHVLVFLPGRHEIARTAETLRRAPWAKGFDIHELHGQLPPEQQDAAVAPGGRPRIVVATNVAETSLTIDGVRLVVDAGLERRASYDWRRGLHTLHIEKISRASADQRAGRAGRTAPGTAIRLWSENDHAHRDESTPAEIHRMDLAEALLLLAAGGVNDLRAFPWYEKPDPEALERALRQLRHLGLLDEDEKLTDTGRQVGALPLPPRHGRVLAEAARRGCLEYCAELVALTQGRPLFPARKTRSGHTERADFAQPGDGSDFRSLHRAWEQMKANRFDLSVGKRLGIHAGACRDADRAARQFLRLAARHFPEASDKDGDQSAVPDDEELARILLTGFSDRIALRRGSSTLACSVVDGGRGQLDRESVAAQHDGPFLAAEIIEVEGRDLEVKLGLCTRLEEAWIREIFPDDFHERDGAAWDERTRRVEARREKRFRDLVLESKASGEVPPGEAAALLAEKVLAGELRIKTWDDSVEQYFARINLLAENFPEHQFPPVDDDARRLLLEQICAGAVSAKEIKDRPVKPALQEWLTPHQRHFLDQFAPERYEWANGKSSKIFYNEGEKPKLSVLIQHLFGVKETPRIGEGRIPLVIEILAPNHRPIQVTEDLPGFWSGSYTAVRAQLRGRYPKHEWPEPK